MEPAELLLKTAMCPRCGAPLMGHVDVTVHPRVRVENGRLMPGPLLTKMRGVRAEVAQSGHEMFRDELTCSALCGYTIHGANLAAQLQEAR